MTTKQAVSEPEVVNEVSVEGYGVRGKDFVEIWHAPRAPQEQIRVLTDQFVKFRNGVLVTRTDEQEAVVQRASRLGRYVRSDPEMTKPLVCKVDNCNTKWYSGDAFSAHTEFAHTGPFRK